MNDSTKVFLLNHIRKNTKNYREGLIAKFLLFKIYAKRIKRSKEKSSSEADDQKRAYFIGKKKD
jgi:hypothetical protein